MSEVARLRRWAKSEQERLDELLSAYLDGQLSGEEQMQLETRLTSDASLQKELEALRRTVAMVRELPRLPVPRNFILPQAMPTPQHQKAVARPRSVGVFPWLTAAAAVAGVFLVLTVTGVLLYLGGVRMAATPPPREVPQQVVQETVGVELRVEKAEVTPEAIAPALILTETPVPWHAPQSPTAPALLKAYATPTPMPEVEEGERLIATAPATLPTVTVPTTNAVRSQEYPALGSGEAEQTGAPGTKDVQTHEGTAPVLRLFLFGIGVLLLVLVTVGASRLRRRKK